MEQRGLASFFYTHGYLCASHPIEVLLLCITGTVCLLTLNIYDATHSLDESLLPPPTSDKVVMSTSIHVHVSATSYFLALLCVYLQCKKIIHGGITVLIGVVAIFLVFSCTVYTSVVGNIFGGELAVLREALPFFCLLSDFVTVSALAKFALSSTSYEEAHSKIGQGVAMLGPSVTLNTLVGVLVIGVGTLSGVEELETASYFGCLALFTHYFMLMTFLPACLSLFLEMYHRGQNQPAWLIESHRELSVTEKEHLPNPLLQHVKVIMSAGLMFVHVHSWFMVKPDQDNGAKNIHNNSSTGSNFSRFLAVNAEEVLAFVLALLVSARYMYLEKDKTGTLLDSQDVKVNTKETPLPSPPASTPPPAIQKTKEPLSTFNSEQSLSTIVSEESLSTIVSEESLPTIIVSNKLPFRQRSATFCCGDDSSLDGNVSDCSKDDLSITSKDSSEILDFKEESKATSIVKKRSFTLPHIPKWKKYNSIQDCILKSSGKALVTSVPSESIKQQKLNIPSVTVTRHDSVSHEQIQNVPVKTVFDKKSCKDGATCRSVQECRQIMKESDGIFRLTDDEICSLVEEKVIPFYQLESALNDFSRAVHIRRKVTTRKINKGLDTLKDLPHQHYDYTLVSGACCENVIGYMPIPVGVAGPLLLDGQLYYIPMATTEGCLVASTNRGCRALSGSGGIRSSILGDGMTRGPVVRFPSAMQASEAKLWFEDQDNFDVIKQSFDATSRFARLKSIKCAVAGRLLFARFVATTGDAMGMNMLSKGTEHALQELQLQFPCLEVISLSGNYCTDKKATAMNWLEGRGKSVVCEAIVPGHIVSKVLKTNVTALTELNTSKNLVGSAMAGAIGGFNAHAANIVTALFIATGQDPAQNVESSNCITLLEPCGPRHEDLYISCTMPSLEVGTIGGGTILSAQASCLEMLGVRGPSSKHPGQHACQLARIICGTVLAGELSLLAALAAGQLVQSHLKHNRSTINLMCNEDAAKNCAVL